MVRPTRFVPPATGVATQRGRKEDACGESTERVRGRLDLGRLRGPGVVNNKRSMMKPWRVNVCFGKLQWETKGRWRTGFGERWYQESHQPATRPLNNRQKLLQFFTFPLAVKRIFWKSSHFPCPTWSCSPPKKCFSVQFWSQECFLKNQCTWRQGTFDMVIAIKLALRVPIDFTSNFGQVSSKFVSLFCSFFSLITTRALSRISHRQFEKDHFGEVESKNTRTLALLGGDLQGDCHSILW